jgi:hypothetical protein
MLNCVVYYTQLALPVKGIEGQFRFFSILLSSLFTRALVLSGKAQRFYHASQSPQGFLQKSLKDSIHLPQGNFLYVLSSLQ